MQVLFLVLNKTECLEDILERLGEAGLPGATILESKGMAQSLSESTSYNELRFMGSLRLLLNPDHRESKTMFMVCEDSQVKTVSAIVNKVTGGLDKPDTGIIFTIPVSYTEGM